MQFRVKITSACIMWLAVDHMTITMVIYTFTFCCLYIGIIVMAANDKIETIRYQIFFPSNVTFIDTTMTAPILIKLRKTENYNW